MTSQPKVHSTYVPSDGPKTCDLMVVGEAPGGEEEAHGRPFIGRSGEKLNIYFADRIGLSREQFYCTNLSKYRPHKNEFKNLLGTPQLEEGIRELREEIEQVKPNVIIAMGNWPMYVLTGKTNAKGEAGKGVMTWRGSVVENTLVPGGPKVYISIHPAFLLRNWKWHPITYDDWSRAYEESAYPELRYPEYDLLVDPPNVEEIVKEICEAKYTSCDIENFKRGQIACVGFSDSADRALVLTHDNPGWKHYTEQILRASVKKIFQFGTYDINYLFKFYGIKTDNYFFDTYVAAASLTPEFPRGLDFLTSIYTRFPYYKEERKTWKDTQDLQILWGYNGKDDVATYIIAMIQMEELKEEFGWTSNQPLIQMPVG